MWATLYKVCDTVPYVCIITWCWCLEVNFLWASHQTHHSSEQYNLSTALRQSTTQNFTAWVSVLICIMCWSPLPDELLILITWWLFPYCRYFTFQLHCLYHPPFSWSIGSWTCSISFGYTQRWVWLIIGVWLTLLLLQVVSTLGPLEWILNTPSHHRVHHGRNPYCIDKNYGIVLYGDVVVSLLFNLAGMLIIWDRIFGE